MESYRNAVGVVYENDGITIGRKLLNDHRNNTVKQDDGVFSIPLSLAPYVASSTHTNCM